MTIADAMQVLVGTPTQALDEKIADLGRQMDKKTKTLFTQQAQEYAVRRKSVEDGI